MRIHIIKVGNRFGVLKDGNHRASKLFNHSEQAYYYAKRIVETAVIAKNKVNNIEEEISLVVHNLDGTVKFKEIIYEKPNTNTSI